MKVQDLAEIPDSYTRFMQSMKFIRTMQKVEEQAAEIRDLALLELREEGHTQASLAEALDISHQRVSRMEKKAQARYGS